MSSREFLTQDFGGFQENMSKVAAAEICLEGVGQSISVKSFWATFCRNLGKLHCRLVHKSISHPINGKYRCWTCLQEFDTEW